MRGARKMLAGFVLPLATVAVLAGCSSGGSDEGKPHGPNGHVEYTGSYTGTFDIIKDIGCDIEKGAFNAVFAPKGPIAVDEPHFFASTSIGMSLALTQYKLFDHLHSTQGLSAAKKDGTWTVTLADTKLVDGIGEAISVNGYFTCTKIRNI